MNNHSAGKRTPNGPQRITAVMTALLVAAVVAAAFLVGPAAIKLLVHVIE